MKKQNKKKFSPHKQPQQQKNDSSPKNNQKSKISANGVKRVAFYIIDKELKQRKVIALGSFYIETLTKLGVENVPAWLSRNVQDYLSIHGKNSSWITIAEFMIFQSLLKRITL